MQDMSLRYIYLSKYNVYKWAYINAYARLFCKQQICKHCRFDHIQLIVSISMVFRCLIIPHTCVAIIIPTVYKKNHIDIERGIPENYDLATGMISEFGGSLVNLMKSSIRDIMKIYICISEPWSYFCSK